LPYQGWTLTKKGKLKQGRTGWLIDENGYYILHDGRRLSQTSIKDELEKKENSLVIGDKDVKKGLEDILKGVGKKEIYQLFQPEGRSDIDINKFPSYIVKEKAIKSEYRVDDELLREHYKKITNLVVIQAFQISVCYLNVHTKLNPANLNNNVKYYSIGEDETGIPIVVTQVGNGNLIDTKKLVIAGPHGDERNAQRIIMSTQKYFIQNGVPTDIVMYFIPCISPTMAFADARGIPVVDENGNKLSIDVALKKTTIPYLHDLIAKKIPINPDNSEETELLRTLIQDKRNGVAFTSYAKYQMNDINEDYPSYGIDTNRDVKPWLASTKNFLVFIRSLTLENPSDIKAIMMHGYESRGAVYGTYEVQPNEKAIINSEGKIFANTFSVFLYGSINKDFYGDTQTNPFRYAGEWGQLLYKKYSILSVDIELSEEEYDEGRRGIKYTPDVVMKEFDGLLLPAKSKFYTLLETYSKEIVDNKNNKDRKE